MSGRRTATAGRRAASWGALWLVFVLIGSFGGAASEAAEPDRLTARIDAVLADKRLRGATVGVHAVSTASGRVFYSRNAMTKLIVASNQKILTAATALRELGADYEFETALFASSDLAVKGDTLEGDLILRGGGDPSLGSRWAGRSGPDQFQRWAQQLAGAGVRRITGDLVADDSFFDRQRVHPDWPAAQLHRPYCAPVSALSVNDNCVTVSVRPGAKVGDPAILSLKSGVPALVLANRCRTLPGRQAVWFKHRPGSLTIEVHGVARHGAGGYLGEVTVPEPALLSAAALEGALRRSGIKLGGRARLVGEADLADRARWRRLASSRTPLPGVLSAMLKHSSNMYAEHVVKTVGAEKHGEGSWRAGLAQTTKLLERLYFRRHEFELADGSGMSRNNRLPPALICSVLVVMDHSEQRDAFREMLPVSGTDGSLARRLSAARYKGKVRAKTGYLRGVGALSGYAETPNGIRVAFSILINNFRGGNAAMREIEDRIVRAIVDLAE